MRKNFGAKPLTYPQPVYIIGTYDENGRPNAMNAAWGGISDYKELYLCLSSRHKTVGNLLKTGAFTVSPATADQVTACDYVGIVSGNNEENKFEKAGFHAERSGLVNAPIIVELPLCVECKVKSYDAKTGILLGEIVNVSADESVLDKNGSVDPEKLRPICFDPFNNLYHVLGDRVGNAFSEGKKLKK